MNFNNPIPRSGLPRFHESSRLRSPRDSDATQRLWQKHRDAGKQAQANSLAIENLQRQIARLRRRGGSPSEGGGSKLTLYDKSKRYSPGKRVVVLPTHELVTTGILDEETELVLKAPAGIYCCQKSAAPVPIDPEADPILYRYNAPKWPTESVGDLEAETTYWWLESLYVRSVITCVDGVDQEDYFNSQPIPEQPL